MEVSLGGAPPSKPRDRALDSDRGSLRRADMRVKTAMLSGNPVPSHPHLALDLTLLLSPIPKASSRQAPRL